MRPHRTLWTSCVPATPWGYQEKTTKRWTPRGFIRPFGGVVFAPDIGVSGGATFMLLSNLGLNVGYARVFIKRLEDGLEIGDTLDERIKDDAGKDTDTFVHADDLRHDPYRVGVRNALFFGVSYNFK